MIEVNPTTGATRRVVGGAFSTPGGLAMAMREGREILIVAESNGYRWVDPTTGNVTRSKYNMAFGSSTGVAANDHVIALTNARMGFVQIIDRAANTLLRDMRELKAPYGAVILGDDDIVVADYTSNSVVRIAGGIVTRVATNLAGPVGMAMAEPNAVYVAERSAGVISRILLSDGSREEIVNGLSGPEGVNVLPDGRLVVAEVDGRRVTVIDAKTKARNVIATDLPLGWPISRAPVGMPSGLAVGRDGAIYINCDGDNSIRKIARTN